MRYALVLPRSAQWPSSSSQTRRLSSMCGACWIQVRATCNHQAPNRTAHAPLVLRGSFLCTAASRALMLLVPRLRRVCKSVRIAGVECHTFCSRELPGDYFAVGSPLVSPQARSAATAKGVDSCTPACFLAMTMTATSHTPAMGTNTVGPPCLLYIHGGGFVGR